VELKPDSDLVATLGAALADLEEERRRNHILVQQVNELKDAFEDLRLSFCQEVCCRPESEDPIFHDRKCRAADAILEKTTSNRE